VGQSKVAHRLNAEVNKEGPGLRREAAFDGLPADRRQHRRHEATIQRDRAKWKKVIEATGIRGE
jgi:hypothetical protein